MRPRLTYLANGYTAIAELGRGGDRDPGVMQLAEILARDSVVLAGTLPVELQQAAVVYAAGVATDAEQPQVSRPLSFVAWRARARAVRHDDQVIQSTPIFGERQANRADGAALDIAQAPDVKRLIAACTLRV